jgi:hypothetical protein
LPSHCRQAIHRQAVAPSIAKPSVAKPFIAVAIKLSIAVALLCRHHVAVKQSITLALPSSQPLTCQLPLGHSIVIALPSCHPLPSPCAVHRRAVYCQVIHCQAIYYRCRCASQPSHSLLLPSRFHQRLVAVMRSIPVALTSSHSSPSSHAIHRQAIHCQAIHRLAIHHHCCHAHIDVALPSCQPLLSRRSQAVHCQAIAASIAEPSVGNAMPMEQPDGNRQLDGNGDEWLGYEWLCNEWCKGLAMDSLRATRWQWTL